MEEKREKSRKHLAYLRTLANRSSGSSAFVTEPKDLATLDISKVVIKIIKGKPIPGQAPEDAEASVCFMYPRSETDQSLQPLILSSPATVVINSELGAPGFKHKKNADPYSHKYSISTSFMLTPHEQVQKAKPDWAELQRKAYENRQKLHEMATDFMMDHQDQFRSYVNYCCDKVDDTHPVEHWMKREFQSPFPTFLSLGDNDTLFEGEKGKEIFELAKKNKEMKYSTKAFLKNYDEEEEPKDVERALAMDHKDEKALLVRQAYLSGKKVRRVPVDVVRGPEGKHMGLFDRKVFSGETVRIVSRPLIWCTGNLAGDTEILLRISVLYRDTFSSEIAPLDNNEWVLPEEKHTDDDEGYNFKAELIDFIVAQNKSYARITDTMMKDSFQNHTEGDIADAIKDLMENGIVVCNDELGFEVIQNPEVGEKRKKPDNDNSSRPSPKKA